MRLLFRLIVNNSVIVLYRTGMSFCAENPHVMGDRNMFGSYHLFMHWLKDIENTLYKMQVKKVSEASMHLD